MASAAYFDTIQVKANAEKVDASAKAKQLNFYYPDAETVAISINETTTLQDLNDIISVFAEATGKDTIILNEIVESNAIPASIARDTAFLTNKSSARISRNAYKTRKSTY